MNESEAKPGVGRIWWVLGVGLFPWAFSLAVLILPVTRESPFFQNAVLVLALCCAMGSIILAVIEGCHLVKAPQKPEGSMLKLFVFCLPAFAIIAAMFIPHFHSEISPENKTIHYAMTISFACKGYASDHDGNFPNTLDELVPQYLPDRRWLKAPIGGNDVNGIGFDYFGGKETDAPEKVLLQSRATSHGKRVIIHVDMSLDIRRE